MKCVHPLCPITCVNIRTYVIGFVNEEPRVRNKSYVNCCFDSTPINVAAKHKITKVNTTGELNVTRNRCCFFSSIFSSPHSVIIAFFRMLPSRCWFHSGTVKKADYSGIYTFFVFLPSIIPEVYETAILCFLLYPHAIIMKGICLTINFLRTCYHGSA